MKPLRLLSSALLASLSAASRSPAAQHVMTMPPARPTLEKGVGHFSEWSRQTKKQFLIDWQAGRQAEWVFVMGNEAGDLDSMTSALAWAYHLEHSTQNSSSPVKAIALLQTQTDALDLRPENKLALQNSKMTSGHDDLLTMDELPEDAETLAVKLKGIVLVDHASPLRKWREAKVLSIFDHHVDQGVAPDASPRIFQKVASCTSLVATQMLDEFDQLPEEYHLPHELLELILSAIAIDSKGLATATATDAAISARVLARSRWADRDLDAQMGAVASWLGAAKKDLDDLSVRDLLRRDWKGDMVDTPSPRTPAVSLGFASIPYSLEEQIGKTGFGELFHWFALHAAWTAAINTDIDICLNKYKVEIEVETAEDGAEKKKKKKKKVREIVLTVRDDQRIDGVQADALFKVVSEALEADAELKLKRWHRADELSSRQMVWTHESGAGRKIIRPIVEAAVQKWDMST